MEQPPRQRALSRERKKREGMVVRQPSRDDEWMANDFSFETTINVSPKSAPMSASAFVESPYLRQNRDYQGKATTLPDRYQAHATGALYPLNCPTSRMQA